tara:strand:+ start:6333 stop:7793 length:1461 start_codon:yes stop_codon:yes gene_type:complete
MLRRSYLLIGFLVLLLFFKVDSRCLAAQLYVGGATVDITPELPVSLTGQMHTRIANKVESNVTATALVLESREGDRQIDYAVFVSCDLIAIRESLDEAVRKKLDGRIKQIDVAKVILNGTHTHTAPTMIEGKYKLPDQPGIVQPAEFVDFAADQIADAVVKAWDARQPGSAGWGLGHAVVAHNRRALYSNGTAQMYGKTSPSNFRGIEGYEDHGLEVLFFWNDKKELIATAINIGCPAQAVGSRSTVNADFWHPVREALRKKYGKDLLVLGWIGAAGDHSPRPMYRNKAEVRMMKLRGLTQLEEIARRIVNGWEEAYAGARQEMHSDPVLIHKVKTIDLPLHPITEADCERVKKEIEVLSKNPDNFRRIKWKQIILDRYEQQQSGEAKPYQMQLHTVRLGDIAIATNNFELFNSYGTQMKARSPALQTFVIQLCGRGTYVPTERAIAGGGYSATIESNTVGPKGGQVLTDVTVESIKDLFDKSQTD